MKVFARSKVLRAPYQKCVRELARGEFKRIVARGPLIGLNIACPACGFVASYSHETLPPGHSCQFVEEGNPPTLVGIGNPPPCYGCQRLLRVTDGYLEAIDP